MRSIKNLAKNIIRKNYTLAIFSSLALVGTLGSTNLKATEIGQMTGVYRSGDGGHYLWIGEDWKDFTSKWKELGREGLRLVDIERYVVDGKAKYAGVWLSGDGPHALWATDSWSKFTKQWGDYSKDGLKLIDIETYESDGIRHYLGVWEAGKYSTSLWSIKGWEAFTDKWKEESEKGKRLIDFESFISNGSNYYVGVFKQSGGAYSLWKSESWEDFVNKWKEQSKNSLRLIDFERILEGNKFKYVGVYVAGTDDYLLYREKPEKFFDKWESISENNMRLIDLELEITGGKPVPEKALGKPLSTNQCDSIGPYRIKGKSKLKGHAYGTNQSKENITKDSIITSTSADFGGAHWGGWVDEDANAVKLVAGACVQEGEIEYTLHYRGPAWRPVPITATLKAGQCACYYKTSAWPERMAFKSTAKVKKTNTRYWHKASSCLRPWRNKCEVKTWEGWK